jgi:hypothetical protein
MTYGPFEAQRWLEFEGRRERRRRVLTERGGPGSGNIGHAGRPGEVGGSAPGGGAGVGVTADWSSAYLHDFRAAVADNLRREGAYAPGQRTMNGWMVAPDGRTFQIGFGNHAPAFADAMMHARLEQEPFEGWKEVVQKAGGEVSGLPEEVMVDMTDLMYDAGFIAVDEHAGIGAETILLAFKGRPPETMAQRRAIKDMVLSGNIAPEFEFKRPTGEVIEGYDIREFEAAVGISMRGGPGSGHFAHEGRPGERGGSLPGEGGPQKGAGDAKGVAQATIRASSAIEPRVTSLMTGLADAHGGRMYQLEFRLKTEESLARKIAAEAHDKGLSPEEAASDIVDVLRYTMVFEREGFVENVLAVQQAMQDAGWEQYDTRWTNYFKPGDAYDGYNTAMFNPETGAKFELQFHTPETAQVKEGAHVIYQRWRETAHTDTAERAKMWTEMTAMWSGIQPPEGWDQLPGVIM